MSCSKKTYQDIPLVPAQEEVVKSMPKSVANSYKNEMDIMIAFLWPKSFKDEEDLKKVQEILSVARSLKNDNDKLLKLNNDFDELKCIDILSGELEVDIDVEDRCYEFDDEINTITAKLADKVIIIKSNIADIDGVWFDNHSDHFSYPKPVIDFNQNTLSFTAIGTYQNTKTPIQYLEIPFSIKQTKDFYTLYFEMDRKRFNKKNLDYFGYFKSKINILALENSIVYQGEFNWHFNGEVQEGVVYWQSIAK